MNLKDILPTHIRSKVYLWVGLFGLAIGSGIVGVAALTAGGLAVPVGLTVGLTALNAVYVYVAGAFGFIAQANTADEDDEEAIDALIRNYASGDREPLPYDVDDEDDSGPVG